ncbi:MAG: M20/M25/M40 family metallo-hydrolase [Aquificae bacterium]|nr:M20/M25/M40 family metallo-hydrolase [Aquificota bacterium]
MQSKQIERVYKDVEFLTSIRPFRNYLNIDSLEKAASYIEGIFKENAEETTIQPFEAEGKIYKNIIASFNIKAKKRIVIGAHYDVAGDTPGADDNASGVAGLLELSRLLKENKPLLKYRIDLVAYPNEEPPFFGTKKMGSYVHAESLYKEKADVEIMICLEMIGYFSDKENSQSFPFPFMKFLYPSTGNFIGVVGKTGQKKITVKIRELIKKHSSIPAYSINAPVIVPGVDYSDHRNYWHFGYKAVMITDTAFYRNPNYHRKTDTIATLDFEKMYQVIKGIYGVCFNL